MSDELQNISSKQELYRLAGQDGGMEAMIEFVKANAPVDPTEQKRTRIEMQGDRVVAMLKRRFRFKRAVGLGEKGEIYYRPHKSEDSVYKVLTVLDRDELIKRAYREAYNHYPTAANIKAFGETLETSVDEQVDYLDDTVIKISKDMYWDRESGDTIEHYDGDCYHQLFNNRARNMDRVQVDIESIDTRFIKSQTERAYEYIKEHDGYFIPADLRDKGDKKRLCAASYFTQDQPLNAFWVWANEDLDKFNDLLKAVAANFMRVKPKGAFILIGRTRNGKSSFVEMLHTLFGRASTSEIKLTQLDDPHFNYSLLSSVLNAPDEEDEGKGKEVLKAQAMFKSMATHYPINVPMFYSQKPQPVPTNFMSYFPMNDTPQWQGTGAEACMRRSFILSFDADLTRFDNNARDFEKETYTADFYTKLLPIIFAFARYYNEHPFKLSDTQQRNQQSVNEEVDNVSVYLGEFQKYFSGGYSGVGIVWEDYKYWCESRGLIWKNKQEFSRKLKVIGGKPSKLTVGDEILNIIRIEKSGKVFHENYTMWEYKGLRVKDLLYPGDGKKPRSVVEYLNTHANQKKRDENREQIQQMDAKEWLEAKERDDADTLDKIKELGW